MGDIVVNSERGERELRSPQQVALTAIKGGASFAEAAQAAGVGRASVYRWLQTDPRFRARYNAWQSEIVQSARARMLALSDLAVGVIEDALEHKDEKVAVKVLTHMGIARMPRPGATDEKIAELEMRVERQREQLRLSEAMVKLLLTKAGYTAAEQRRYIRERGLVGPEEAAGLTEADQSDALSATSLEDVCEDLEQAGELSDVQPDGDRITGETNEARRETNVNVSHPQEEPGQAQSV